MNGIIEDILLGIFPSMGHFGGIQASGRIAWEGITSHEGPKHKQTKLVCYEPDYGRTFTETPGTARTSSKTGALISAVKNGGSAGDILIWHLGLLKIVAFIPTNNSRLILFLHGIESWRSHGPLTSRLLSRVDLFLSNSDYTWHRFVENNPAFAKAEHRTVPLGIGSLAEEISPTPSRPVALMVGRMSRDEDYKGHREVLNAWSRVGDRIPGAELWVVGDGDLKCDLEQTARANNLDGQVRFLGAVTEERKHELYSQSRCLVLPSRGEGFGFVYVEAMRAGRPSLVSTLDAGREVINPPEAGLAANPHAKQDLAEALGSTAEREARGVAGRTLANNFAWPMIARQMSELYTSVQGAPV